MTFRTLIQRAATASACLLATATALTLSVSAASANLLGNPGFELPAIPAGPPEYYGAGATWVSFGGGIYTVGAAVNTPNSGNQSLKLFGGCCSGAFQQFSALPGETWNGGVWMKNSSLDPMGGGQIAAVNIEWIAADGSTQISFISNGTFDASQPRDVWTLQTITGVAPPGTAYARLVLITGDFAPGGPGGAPFMDDAFFERVTVVPTHSPTWGQLKTTYR